MKTLKFGCKRSAFILSPSNYKELKKDSKELQWFVMCRFYEPNQKPYVFKKKVISSLSLKDKKLSLKVIEDMMSEYLDLRDYNPRTKEFMIDKSGFHKELPFLTALEMAIELKEVTPEYKKALFSYLKKVTKSAKKLNLDIVKIYDIELLHIKRIISDCAISNNDYNKTKKILSSLFAELVNEGCIKVNPCIGIKTKTHITPLKKVFTEKELLNTYDHIKENFPHFVNYFQIFLMSASRNSELLRLKKKDVNLEKQEFTIKMIKGGVNSYEKRIIFKEAMPFWENQLSKCKSKEDYLFSDWFEPGQNEKPRASVYRWWKNNIMKKLNTDITIYSLKHYFLDKLDEANYNAQKSAGHRKKEITGVYTVGKKDRELEFLKTIDVKVM